MRFSAPEVAAHEVPKEDAARLASRQPLLEPEEQARIGPLEDVNATFEAGAGEQLEQGRQSAVCGVVLAGE